MPDALAEITAALARIPLFAGRTLDDIRVETLPSLTNRNYKVDIGTESYVLRFAGVGTQHYIDRTAEATNAGFAAAIGIAPAVLFADPASGLMLTRFIAGGVALTPADLRRDNLLRDTALLLRRLHDSRLPFVGRMELFPKLDEYIALASRRGWPDGLDMTPIRGEAEAARLALERTAVPLVPGHIDPVPHNFIAGRATDGAPALYLLDWEYSAMAEPMWDLAAVSIEAQLDTRQDELLLATYFAAAAPQQAGRFAFYKASLNLLAAAWAIVQIVDGNPRSDFAAFARERLAWHRADTESAVYRRYMAGEP